MRTKEMQKEEVLSIRPECVKKDVDHMDYSEFKIRIDTLPAKTLDLPNDTIVEVQSDDFSIKFSSRVSYLQLSYIIDYEGNDDLIIYVDRSMYKFSQGEMISLYTLMKDENNAIHKLNVEL